MDPLKVEYTTFPVLLEVIPDRTQEHSQSSSADLLFSSSLILNDYLYFVSGATFSSLYYGVIFSNFQELTIVLLIQVPLCSLLLGLFSAPTFQLLMIQ